MKIKKYRYFVGDFETTSYKGQEYTEVWASALVELFTENVKIVGSIEEQIENFINFKENIVVYYHNLKWDGNFIISYLLRNNYVQAYADIGDNKVKWLDDKEMPNKSFKFMCSKMGSWYTLAIKINNKFIELRDSYKLLPFSVENMGESFKTKHRKLSMEYAGFRYANCPRTAEEDVYIRNDVLVVKECIELMFEQGHDSLTIGSCCLRDFKDRLYDDWEKLFPNVYDIKINKHQFGDENLGEYIRKSYRGGWCYVKKGCENKVYEKGITMDVNSLYSSVMHSMSGNLYPIGKGEMWKGNFIPDKALKPNMVYFIRIKTRFYLKEKFLPFIQIKHSWCYKGNEMLETTDFNVNGTYCKTIQDSQGNDRDSVVTMALTMMDFELLKKHYELVDFEILDGCYFYGALGIFDDYINHYAEIKMTSVGAVRESAKLFLNNLYGKMASSEDSSFKIAFLDVKGKVKYRTIMENDKTAGYIPVGSFVTSYARLFDISSAQANYDAFIYSDTDSNHLACDISEVKGMPIHDSKFCHWKLESVWDKGLFVRQKTYIEHVTHTSKNGEIVEVKEPHYEVKCAGMNNKCKDMFISSVTGELINNEKHKYNEDDLKWIKKKRELTDFKVGLEVRGKLMPRTIIGGLILEETTYKMR